MKSACVTPLYKGKGAHRESTSYRPIAGLTSLTKVLEKVLFFKLSSVVDALLNDEQHGFPAHRSCYTALSRFTQQIYYDIDGRNMRAGAVFVDFRKAYNSVNHDLLILKLIELNIDPNIVCLIKNYLDNSVFKIKSGKNTSEYYYDPAGVPQGSTIACLPFCLYINDICKLITSNNTLYADDEAIYTANQDPNIIVSTLQIELTNVSDWCKDNLVSLNETKTEWMFFHKANDTNIGTIPPLMLEGREIRRVMKFKYLGVSGP